MSRRHNRYYYLKYCFRAKKLVVRSENRSLRNALDALSSIKIFIQDAIRRGYAYLFSTNLPPQSFNADPGVSGVSDFLDTSITPHYIEDTSIEDSFFMSDFDVGLLRDNHFDDDPIRGMWDITSIYYSTMHQDNHDY